VVIPIIFISFVLATLVFWRRRPAEPLPLYLCVIALAFLVLQRDRSGYDLSVSILGSCVLAMVYTLRNNGVKPRKPS